MNVFPYSASKNFSTEAHSKKSLEINTYTTPYDQGMPLHEEYQKLLEENAQLKRQMGFRQSFDPRANVIYTPQELQAMAEHMFHQKPQNYYRENQEHLVERVCQYDGMNIGHLGGNNLPIKAQIQRKHMLQQKLALLKSQYQRQGKIMRELRQANGGCKQCYEKKYIDLLRITSPF